MIGIIGISYKTSTVEVREKFSFTMAESVLLMRYLLETIDISGIVLVSTCNRTEIYFHSISSSDSLMTKIEEEVFLYKKMDIDEVDKLFYYYTDDDCYKHLFKLTSGLDSMVLGETQILGQIKDAYRLSVESGCSSSILSRCFHKAFEAGKKVRNIYNITSVPFSAGSAAVDLVLSKYPDWKHARVLIVGAGQMAERVIEGLLRYNVTNIVIYNRTLERSQKLAMHYRLDCMQDNDLRNGIERSNLIFVATSALCPVILPSMVSNKDDDPTLFFDLAVPRNIDAQVETIPGNKVLTIDSLKNHSNVMMVNEQNIIQADKLIDQLVSEFSSWLTSLTLTPTIDLLEEKFNEVLNLRLNFMENKVSEREFELISQTGKFMKDKYLKNIIASLKDLSENGAKPMYLDMINKMIESTNSRKS